MSLAIFDLDNTLLKGDCEELWWQYLAEHQLVEAGDFAKQRKAVLADGDDNVDPIAYTEVSVKPLALLEFKQLLEMRQDFVNTYIAPVILPKAVELIEEHRAKSHTLLIITASNRFIASPIAKLLEIDNLIATEVEKEKGECTGKVTGTPSFREGKIHRLHEWLAAHHANLDDSYFYSDSHHDVALLEQVTFPIAVDPTKELKKIAKQNKWKVISLRG